MDKETLSNYGWVVIAVLVLSIMIALATPFGTYISDGVKATTAGLFETSKNALDTGLEEAGIVIEDQEFDSVNTIGGSTSCKHSNSTTYGDDTKCNDCGAVTYGAEIHSGIIPVGAVYTTGVEVCAICEYDLKNAPCWCGNINRASGVEVCSTCDFNINTSTCHCGRYLISDYAPVVTYNEGDIFPTIQTKDIYRYEDYSYLYEINEWNNVQGWVVSVTNINKQTYSEILSNINNVNVVNVCSTFEQCGEIIAIPDIPSTVVIFPYISYYQGNIYTMTYLGSKQDCFERVSHYGGGRYDFYYGESFTIKCNDGEAGVLFTSYCNSGCGTTGKSFIYGEYIKDCHCGYTVIPSSNEWVIKN